MFLKMSKRFHFVTVENMYNPEKTGTNFANKLSAKTAHGHQKD